MEHDDLYRRNREMRALICVSASLLFYSVVYAGYTAARGQEWHAGFLFLILIFLVYMSWPVWAAHCLRRGKGVQAALWFLLAISPIELGMLGVVVVVPFMSARVPTLITISNCFCISAYVYAIYSHSKGR
jgi:hypothetical protein